MTPDIAALTNKLKAEALERNLFVYQAELLNAAADALSRLSAPLPNEPKEHGDCVLIPKTTWNATVNKINELTGRLTAPLPEEIAGLIASADIHIRAYVATHNGDSKACQLIRDMAAALRTLSEANAYLEIGANHHHEQYAALAQENERLKAERDASRRSYNELVEDTRELRNEAYEQGKFEAEGDIRRKTDELLDFTEASLEHISNPLIAMHLKAQIAAIRSLAQTDEHKPETEK